MCMLLALSVPPALQGFSECPQRSPLRSQSAPSLGVALFFAAAVAGGGGGGQRREGRWHWATTTAARPSELASPISPSEHVVRGLVLHSALNRLLPACVCRGR